MPRKQGRPALTPEEREERREARNQKARDERAQRNGRVSRVDDNDDDDEPRGKRGRPGWVMLVIGALVALIAVMLIRSARRKREDENEIETEGLGAENIMVKRLDGQAESLQYWTVGITKHMAKCFAELNAEQADTAQRVNATERRLTELEKE